MSYMTVDEYAKLKGVSKQAIYKQIKLGKLRTITDTSNRTLIEYIVENESENYTIIDDESSTTPINNDNATDQLDVIKGFLSGLLEQYSQRTEVLVSKLEESQRKEVAIIKESYAKMESMQNDRISQQKEEIDKLKQEIERLTNRSGLFKKLFG